MDIPTLILPSAWAQKAVACDYAAVVEVRQTIKEFTIVAFDTGLNH